METIPDFVPVHDHPMPSTFSGGFLHLSQSEGRAGHLAASVGACVPELPKDGNKMLRVSPASAFDEALGLFQRYPRYHCDCYVTATAGLRFLLYPRSHTSVFRFACTKGMYDTLGSIL